MTELENEERNQYYLVKINKSEEIPCKHYLMGERREEGGLAWGYSLPVYLLPGTADEVNSRVWPIGQSIGVAFV